MIQRIQTIYLAIAIVLLAIVTIGTKIFSFVTETATYNFNSYGVTEFDAEGKFSDQHHYPVYVGTIALILLAFLCLMSYKNLERQFKLGRTVFYLYFVMLIMVLLMSFFGDSLVGIPEGVESTRKLGLGFFLFVAGFPFTFLANTGIKRDKRLLDSLDRLR